MALCSNSQPVSSTGNSKHSQESQIMRVMEAFVSMLYENKSKHWAAGIFIQFIKYGFAVSSKFLNCTKNRKVNKSHLLSICILITDNIKPDALRLIFVWEYKMMVYPKYHYHLVLKHRNI